MENALKTELVNHVLFGMAQFSTLGEPKGTQAYRKKKNVERCQKKSLKKGTEFTLGKINPPRTPLKL